MIQHAIYILEIHHIYLILNLLPKPAHCAEDFMAFFAATITKLLVNEACDKLFSAPPNAVIQGSMSRVYIACAIYQYKFLIVFHATVLLFT